MATETLLPSGFTTNTWTSGAYTDIDNGVDTPTDSGLLLSTELEGAVLLIDFADLVTIVDADTVSQVDVRYRGHFDAANTKDGVEIELLISSSVVGVAQVPALTSSMANYTVNDSVTVPDWNQDFTAAQLNSLQVRVTTTQTGKAGATDLDLSEIEVVITYTAAGGVINTVTLDDAVDPVDDIDLVLRDRQRLLTDNEDAVDSVIVEIKREGSFSYHLFKHRKGGMNVLLTQ